MMKQLQKPGVQMLLLFVVVAGGAGAYILSKQAPPPANVSTKEDKPTGKGVGQMAVEEKKVEAGDKRSGTVSGSSVSRLVLPKEKPKPPTITAMSSAQQKKDEKPPPLPRLVHIDKPQVERFEVKEPTFFAPRGLLIKAALVITVDSSSFDTPVLAMVTEDVYFNQRLIVPAGTQVIAKAAQGRSRDRIAISGGFTFIWADGREYSIPGIALDHERLSDGSYGITDGSAGIRGQIVENDRYAEMKILFAEALQGIMNNNQSQFQSIYGLAPQNTSRNAALGGGSQAAASYSEMLTKKLDEDLDFVRVPAGTQFYIFTEAVFEPEMASIGGLKQAGGVQSSWELAADTYARAQADQTRLRPVEETSAQESGERERSEANAAQISRVRGLLPTSSSSTPPATSSADRNP